MTKKKTPKKLIKCLELRLCSCGWECSHFEPFNNRIQKHILEVIQEGICNYQIFSCSHDNLNLDLDDCGCSIVCIENTDFIKGSNFPYFCPLEDYS